MAENNIDLKSIRKLLGMNFFIPSYQRGYRWTLQQVEDLLEDIKDFSINPSNFYCLQPIVVKEMTDNQKQLHNLDEMKQWYEVIDGQQRLTTLLLILNAYKIVLENCDLPTDFYNIKYERELSNDIQTKLLDDLDSIKESDDSTIDRWHVSNAMIYIKKWKEEKHINASKFCNSILDYEPDPNDSSKDIAKNIRVIWYECVEEDPITVFTRLNIGKISLTNAELVKALMLNRENFKKKDNPELIRLRQQEIATEWDTIENTFQDNSFWLFLHEAEYDRPTRIDFIFDLIAEQNALKLPEEELKLVGSDQYRTFRYFYAYFKNKQLADIEECWEKVKKYFQAFSEWYDDAELYHYIGYHLTYSRRGHKDLINKWMNAKDKDAFKTELKKLICQRLDKCPPLEYNYNVEGTDKRKCEPILLFHNIQTAINMNKHSASNILGMAYRFPFDAYKLEGWDVEHINSNTTNPEEDNETRKEWLINVYLSVTEDLQKEIVDYFDGEKRTEEDTTNLFNKVKSYIPELEKWTQQDKNRLWNYVLLDSSTNRSYGNSIFSAKRRIIITKDSGKDIAIPILKRDGSIELRSSGETRSCFVPPVTKQVFLKYYSATAGNNNYWDLQMDAPAYLADIESCINQLKTETNGKQ